MGHLWRISCQISILFCSMRCIGAEDATIAMLTADFRKYTSFIFHYASENNRTVHTSIYPVDECTELLRNPYFVAELPTAMYVHGFHTNQSAAELSTLVESYVLHNKNFNMITLDWDHFAYLPYYEVSSPLAPVYGEWVGQVFYNCSTRSGGALSPAKLHLIGASLGAHICGGIGRAVYRISGSKVSRITGLDPAGPNFEGNSPNAKNRLEENDAEFVDIIHGDAGFYGVNCSIGMADFWPNNGTRTQRGCPPTNATVTQNEDHPCSHVRPILYFNESVRNATKSMAFYAAKRYFNGTMSAHGMDIVEMGINCRSTARGNFYLATDTKPPFSLGILGIK